MHLFANLSNGICSVPVMFSPSSRDAFIAMSRGRFRVVSDQLPVRWLRICDTCRVAAFSGSRPPKCGPLTSVSGESLRVA